MNRSTLLFVAITCFLSTVYLQQYKSTTWALQFGCTGFDMDSAFSQFICKAGSQDLTTLVNVQNGVEDLQVVNKLGTKADLLLTVETLSPSLFVAFGNISFGIHTSEPHVVYFTSGTPGQTFSSTDGLTTYGGAVWNVTTGVGNFKGATGYMAGTAQINANSDGKTSTATIDIFGRFLTPQ
mmetsp:Transcript_23778/g.26386  ORF Transcript_23778/g.26386 Transcript_23778/m.26386 type:complete len:181 (+) Transcript_23778:101-643(+)